MLSGCSQFVEWQEEVKMNDGRVIVVTQRRRCEGGNYTAKFGATCVAREAWVTLKIPEISPDEIVWNESLDPMIVNMDRGTLYIIGLPPHTLEFRKYGATNPPYFAFRWKGGWRRVPYTEIPAPLRIGNMLIESIPKIRTAYLTIAEKESPRENGDGRYPKYHREIDPDLKLTPY